MKPRFFTKRPLVTVGVVLFVLICCRCIYFYYETDIHIKALSTICDLADARMAFCKFREVHHRWPHAMTEVYGVKTSEGGLNEKCTDYISDTPFCCVTDKELYYKIGTERPYKVLVMLSQPYKTQLWPFGETRTMIATESGVHTISPSEIIDRSQKGDKR